MKRIKIANMSKENVKNPMQDESGGSTESTPATRRNVAPQVSFGTFEAASSPQAGAGASAGAGAGDPAGIDLDDDADGPYMSLPPLMMSENNRRELKRAEGGHKQLSLFLKVVDVVSINIGSIMFIVGSIYFYPEYKRECKSIGMDDCAELGALLFVIGSALFLLGACISFKHHGGFNMVDKSMLLNAYMYILANTLFVVGSFFFFPGVAAKDTDIPGLWMFLIGSMIFVLAPVFNIFRATQMKAAGQISDLHFRSGVIIAILYIVGSGSFVIGTILFFPSIYQPCSVTIFVIGSVLFLISTLLTPLKYSWNDCVKKENQRLSERTISRGGSEMQPVV